MGREPPRCHPRGPEQIKDEISNQKYLHVWHFIERVKITKDQNVRDKR